jgi:hypothetical protein
MDKNDKDKKVIVLQDRLVKDEYKSRKINSKKSRD